MTCFYIFSLPLEIDLELHIVDQVANTVPAGTLSPARTARVARSTVLKIAQLASEVALRCNLFFHNFF